MLFRSSFGGFYSPESLIKALTTHTVVVDSLKQEPWQPSNSAYQWFVQAVFNALPPGERDDLRRLNGNGLNLSPQERAALPTRERAIYNLLANRDPQVFGELYDELPADLRTAMAKLAPLSNLPWLITAYLIANTSVTTLYGKISDIHGRRTTLIISISMYMLGSDRKSTRLNSSH